MPQLVHGNRCLAGTYCKAFSITSETSSADSMRSVATSMTPTSTSLPFNSFSSSIGTFEWMHSSETCLMRLFARAGKISAYWRHSPPSVLFQSMLAWMP